MTLQRRTPLRRSTKPLARGRPLPARAARPKRRAESDEGVDKGAVRRSVFERDGWRCRLDGIPGAGPCFGPLTFHHIRKEGQGGAFTVENGAALCSGHNTAIESDALVALIARTSGLVLRAGDEWTVSHERFWQRVDRDGPLPAACPELGPCWLWTGALMVGRAAGYGAVRIDGQFVLAHRFALGTVEALVAGLEVDHRCRVRGCVNPRHLEQVTKAENVARQNAAMAAAMTHCRAGHEYTPENTGSQRAGKGRYCRQCRRDRTAERRARREAAA